MSDEKGAEGGGRADAASEGSRQRLLWVSLFVFAPIRRRGHSETNYIIMRCSSGKAAGWEAGLDSICVWVRA